MATPLAQSKSADAVAAAIKAAKDKKIFRSATVGCYAVNLTQNRVLAELDATQSLIPASTFKLLTTAAALETLGPDFQFTTVLQYDGEIDAQGTLQGNIYIKGGGDPTLGSTRFKQYFKPEDATQTWIKAIQAKGIRKIAGAIIGDAQIYAAHTTPDTWTVQDIGSYYGASCSGLSIFDNLYTVILNASAQEEGDTEIVRVFPALPTEVEPINQVKIASTNVDQAYIYGGPHATPQIIRGTIPKGKPRFAIRRSMPTPTYWAAYTLNSALNKQGIETGQPPTTVQRRGATKEKRRNINTLYSPPLYTIIKVVNHETFNLYAEHLLIHLGLARFGRGDYASGTRALKAFWTEKGIDVTGMLLHDGSGLSRYNALTVKQLVEVLRYMKTSDHFPHFYASLPTAGETGNLVELFQNTPLQGKFRAKSGTLKNIRGFAGYYTYQNGDEIVLALLVNHYDGPRSGAENEIEKILTALVQEP
ncbi:MAG: D-alanyl-D-alanine carboxypeptidase/D-alanyl-D-alanine-endopeptidase [Roseivirga sp.]